MWAFWALMLVLTVAGIVLDAPDGGGGPSAFFIDNKIRRTTHATIFDDLRYWLKVALLFFALYIEYVLLFEPVQLRQAKKGTGGSLVATSREWLCLFCGAGFIARVLLQMAVFWRRSISWVEVFAETGIIIPVSLASMAFGAAQRCGAPLSFVEVLGLLVFLLGTFINVWPEYTRHVWKLDPTNAGHLYVGGLFAVCRHINYFGEVLSFVGFAMATSTWWNLWIPLVMGAGLIIWSVPELDAYLSTRYASEWSSYTQQVPCQMVPFVW